MKSDTRKSIIRAQVSPAALTCLQSICERRGMTQISVVSRLLEYLHKQTPEEQGRMLGHYAGDETPRRKVAKVSP